MEVLECLRDSGRVTEMPQDQRQSLLGPTGQPGRETARGQERYPWSSKTTPVFRQLHPVSFNICADFFNEGFIWKGK